MRSVLTVTKTVSIPERDSWILDKCNIDDELQLELDEEHESSNSEEDSEQEPVAKRMKMVEKGTIDTEKTVEPENNLSAKDHDFGSSPVESLKTKDT